MVKIVQKVPITNSLEKKSVTKFLKRNPQSETNPNSFIKRDSSDLYLDSDWVPATSNDCERLFSSAKLVYQDLRKSLTPRNLEILLFLKMNRKYWDIEDVKALYFELMVTRTNKDKETIEIESEDED
jgi:hypothetical protein